MKALIFPIGFLICTLVFLWTTGQILLSRVQDDLNYDVEKETKKSGGLFQNNNKHFSAKEKKELAELKFRKYDSLIAVFTGLAFFLILHSLLLEDFYQLLIDYQEGHNYTVAGLAIVFCILGNLSASLILNNLGKNSNLHDTNNFELLHSRGNRLVTFYLAFIFFALFFAFFAELDLKFNILKAVILSFLFGNGIYYILRQNFNLKSVGDIITDNKK